MKICSTFLIYLTTIFALVLTNDSTWEQHKQAYNKNYTTVEEEHRRYLIFKENIKKIQNHNALYDEGEVSYRLGVTNLTDLTEDEFSKRTGNNRGIIEQVYEAKESKLPPNLRLKPFVDWREVEGVVPEVPDTTGCDAAWALTTVASIEALNFIQNNEHTRLSVQELVDCADFGEFNSGCDGGYVDNAFNYIINNGLNLNDTYPWSGETESICADYGDDEGKFRIAGVKKVGTYFLNLEMALAFIGPMVALMDARFIQDYNGTYVFGSDDCSTSSTTTINHPVLVVGYNGSFSDGYWIIRNSWGTSWGDKGYLFLTKDTNRDCGITKHVLYPVLD